MNRRTFLASALAAPAVSGVAAPAERPNFLFMIADDLTYRGIRAMGNPEVETPNLDALMKRGCPFTHAFHQGSWTGAVCIASRSMLNSGLTAFRAQKQIEQVPLWGQTMGDAGYATTIVGKWHLSKTTLERSFRDHATVYMDGMFESGKEAYGRPAPGNTWSPSDTSLGGQWLHAQDWRNAASEAIQHSAQVWADTAADRLAEMSKKSDPFLLYVAFTSPHDPRQAPKEIVDRYPASKIAIPPNYLPVHPFDQGDRDVRDELLAPFPRTREAVQLHRSEYYAHITYLDRQVGRILDALKESGKAANTYVVFTADHGLAVGQHGLLGKQNLYDHSTRVPLIVTGPGIRAGRRVDEMVYQHSVFPTTCELAGVAIPKTVEFPSLANWLRGSDGPKNDSMFCWYRDFQRSVRTVAHKLIAYPQAKRVQIFDLKRDPWETKDVGDDPAYASVRKDLVERLKAHQKELSDPLTLTL
jgi:arylsulfatase A-like enzyme